MNVTVEIPQKVLSDIEGIASWYGSKDIELEERVLNEIKRKINTIKAHPEMFQEMGNDQRRAVLGSSFPYSIYYSVNIQTKTVRIDGIFHHMKNPEKVREEIHLERVQTIRDAKQKKQERLKQLEDVRKREEQNKSKGKER